MSECYYNYKFYFTNPGRKAELESADDECPEDQFLEQLDLDNCLDEDREDLEGYKLGSNYFGIDLVTSTSADINHKLIRASKNIGTEVCSVKVFNNQVGEGGQCWLFRGQNIPADKLDAVLDKFGITEDIADSLEDIFEENNVTALQQKIDAGLDVNQHVDGEPLLVLAADAYSLPCFKLLLEKGANPNATTEDGDAVLFRVIDGADSSSLTDYIKSMVSAGVDLNQCDSEGASALWHIMGQDKYLGKQLAKQGVLFKAPDDAYNDEEESAVDKLYTAISHQDNEQISTYFKLAAKDKNNWYEIAQTSCTYDYLPAITTLMKHGFSPFKDEDGEESMDLLYEAVSSQSMNVSVHLLEAAKADNKDVAEAINDLMAGLSTNDRYNTALKKIMADYDGKSTLYALGEALENNATNNLKTLLSQDIRISDEEQEEGEKDNFLHHQLETLDAEKLQLLLDAGFDPSLEGDYEQTLFERAFTESNIKVEVKKILLNACKKLDKATQLDIYLKSNLAKPFEQILTSPDNPVSADQLQQLLMTASKNGTSSITKLLLANGASPTEKDADGNTPLAIAVQNNQASCAAHLLKAGANANDLVTIVADEDEDDDDEIDGMMAKALGLGDEFTGLMDTAEMINEPIKMEGSDSSVLMVAASEGDPKLVQLLLHFNADVNFVDETQHTALCCATLNGHSHVIDLLIQAGADIQITNNEGQNLLYMAAYRGHAELCEKYLALGVEVDQRDTDLAQTPLIIAAVCSAFHDEDVCSVLINANADVNAQDNDGLSPLMAAAMLSNDSLIAQLLEKGASIDLQDKEKKTAYDYYIGDDGDEEELEEPEGFALSDLKSEKSKANKKSGFFGLFSKKKKKTKKSKKEKAPMALLGLSALAKAMDAAEEQEKENKKIQESWDDDK